MNKTHTHTQTRTRQGERWEGGAARAASRVEGVEAEAEAGGSDEVAREAVGVTPWDEAVGREGVVTVLEGLD